MKIQWDGKPPPATPSSKPDGPSSGVNAPQFADSLKSAMGTTPATPPAPGAPLAGIEGVRPPIEIASAAMAALDTVPLVSSAETLLTRMEDFVAQLGDPGVDLKSLGPVVTELSAQKEELSSAFQSLPENHPLKEIVGDVLKTVYTALGQFYRGDFGS